MNFWRAVAAIVIKDVVAEFRSKEILSSIVVFALMVVVIFNFAFELHVENTRQVLPGVLWVAFVFAGIMGINHSFVLEREGGCLDGLMLVPIDRSSIYVGKCLGNIVFLLIMEALILPIVALLFDVALLNPILWLIVILGTVGLSAVGTLFAAMTVNARTRELMLPVLLFPTVVPLIIASTKSTAQALNGQLLPEICLWLRLLLAFDVIFIAIALLTFEYVLEG